MKKRLLLVVLLLVGCAAILVPYKGPYDVFAHLEYHSRRVLDPPSGYGTPAHFTTYNWVTVINPGEAAMKLRLDCKQTIVTIYLPARTTTDIPLTPGDNHGTCTLQQLNFYEDTK